MHGNGFDIGVEEEVGFQGFWLLMVSVKSSQGMTSPTSTAPKLLQMQRPLSMTGDGAASKENGLGSPRRSFDSSSGSIRSDTLGIHPLKYTWVGFP